MPLTSDVLIFEDLVSAVGTAQLYTLGTRRDEDGKVYRYVKYESGTGAVAALAGGLVYHLDGLWDVTGDASDASLDQVAGVLVGAPADEGFGWMQTYGRHAAVKTNGDDDIAEGVKLIGSATDLSCNSMLANTAGTNTVIGVALADDVDAANTVDAFLNLGG